MSSNANLHLLLVCDLSLGDTDKEGEDDWLLALDCCCCWLGCCGCWEDGDVWLGLLLVLLLLLLLLSDDDLDMDDVLDIFELVDDMSDGFVPPTIAESATNFTPRVFIRSSIISLFTRELSISSYTHTHTTRRKSI